jgi:protein phosphatase
VKQGWRVTPFDRIEIAVLTDVGLRRSHNQDNHAHQLATSEEQWQNTGHVFLVADGMGAHAVGEKASEQAVHVIPHIYQKHAPGGVVTALRRSFLEANASIYACGQANREFEGMGTTGTALVLRPEGAWVAHVGDSRCYRLRDGVLEQLTFDHSLVWEYARRHKLDPEAVKDIPPNVILRCLGPEALVQVDVEGPYPLQPGDTFLLCSDGLSGPLSDLEIGAVAGSMPPADACKLLVNLANLRGGPDNITVMIVHVPQDGPTSSGSIPVPASGPPIMPWWLTALLGSTALVALAGTCAYFQLTALSYLTFALAAVGVGAGFVGLWLRHQQEANTPENERPRPRIHRRTPCHIEPALVEKVAKALRNLEEKASQKGWEVDWDAIRRATSLAEQAAQAGDLTGAFREYGRAMMPLARAFEKQRNREESFQPVWDRAR